MRAAPNTIDLGVIDNSSKPIFSGIEFDSRPAAMRHLLVAKKIIDRHKGEKNNYGLDIGSKYGYLRRILKVYGINAKRLDIVEREDKDGLIKGNGKTLPFKNNSLDFIVVSHVLAHVEDLPQFMKEIWRTLKVDGDLIILQNNRYGWWKYWGYYIKRNDRAFHYRTFSSWDLKELLRQNNLKIEEMNSPYYFYLHSKFSNLCYKFDRNYGHLLPSWLATQWLIVATKSQKHNDFNVPIKIPIFIRIIIEPFAFFHSILIKILELVLRIICK